MCSVASVRRCHVGLLSRLPKLMLWQGRMVMSAHVGLPLINDGLRVRGMVKLSCGPAPTPSAGVGAIFSRKGLVRQESPRGGRARRRHPRGGPSEGGGLQGVRSIQLCLNISWIFNIVATPDQQHEPSFAWNEQKTSLGVLLMVVKCKI